MSVRFAWPSFSKPWSVALDELTIDGDREPEHIDSTRKRLRLDYAGDWEAATFDITATTDEPVPADVAAVSAFAVISSPRANTRIPFRLNPVGSGATCFTGRVGVQRAALAASAELTVDIGAEFEDRHRLIGIGDAWSVIVDAAEAPTPPGKPPFETAWVDFTSSVAPLLARQQPEAYAVMDLTDGPPRLLLNEAVDGLKALLLAPTARHEKRRLREIIGTSIAMQATATLLRAATSEVVPLDPDESEPEIPDGLYAQVCEAIAGELTSIASVSEFYERVVEAARATTGEYAELWAEVDAAISRITGHSSAVAGAVAEVKYV